MEDARDLARCLAEAEDISGAVGQRPTTTHLLLALFTVPAPAAELLKKRGVDGDRILAAMAEAPKEPASLATKCSPHGPVLGHTPFGYFADFEAPC